MQCAFTDCMRNAVSKGYCDKHYRRLLKNGNASDYGSRKVDEGNAIERFHRKYKIDKSGCWLWIGGTRLNSKGVPYSRHWTDDKKSIGGHRFSYELTHGFIPNGLYVCHKCDTPLCVNPYHLFVGTHHDNMRDMVQKGRSFVGRGENKIGRSKLTNNQAQQIRLMQIPQSKIAAIFGVSQTTIGRIKRKESY